MKGRISYKKALKWCKSNGKELTNVCYSLMKHEGVVPQFYYDSKSNLTFGIGHNCRANKLNQLQYDIIASGDFDSCMRLAFRLLEFDTLQCEIDLANIFPKFDDFYPERQDALVEMMFQLGYGSFSGFKRMIKAIKQDDWETAYKEAKNSKWYREYESRASEVIEGFKE